MSQPKKSLLERYGIPVHHLDFKYIGDCKDAREMEKIVHILRSGEEGYYPDLMKCAEDKLRELKPQSRLFRLEEQIRGRETLPAQEWKPIYDWNHDIKAKDKKLQKLSQDSSDSQLPPVRKNAHISLAKKEVLSTPQDSTNCHKSDRIKSTDYRKWDQYDADEEILRQDLAEERAQEEVERKNLLNSQKYNSRNTPKIEEIFEETEKEKQQVQNLSEIEKEKLSEEFRLRGNEYFRAKEFDNALAEYTRAIQIYPEKAVGPYNNRAVTYFKQQKFLESIKDCEACLALDPRNLKARLRLAEANYAYGRRRESYQLYIDVLEVDPQNAVALKAIGELRKMFEDLPPPNATRLQISDEGSSKVSTQNQSPQALNKAKAVTNSNLNNNTTSKSPASSQPNKWKNYDLAELVKPNRVVKNKLLKAAETLGKMQTTMSTEKSKPTSNKSPATTGNGEKNIVKRKQELQSVHKNEPETSNVISELLIPGTARPSTNGKPLIEEILN